MASILSRHLQNAQRAYRISAPLALTIFTAPFVILGLFFFLISFSPTQDFAALMTFPNYPIEWVTFASSLLGGILSWRLAFLLKAQGEEPLIWLFYLVFGLGLIWTAGETSAWGQQVLGYRTPDWMQARNAQGQMTLHNMYGWQDHNHWLRAVFAIGGFIGIALQKSSRFRKIAVPAILFSWFLAIAIKCVLDFWTKSFPAGIAWDWEMFKWIVNRTSKVAKMMVGMAALLYVWLNIRTLVSRESSASS